MKYDNLLRYTVRILNAYTGDIPLQGWLKNFFRENPQMGSRDRKQVSEMAYCYFRLGHTLKNISKEDRILTGLFLANHQPELLLEHLRPEWHEQITLPITEKIHLISARFPEFNLLDIFPWKDLLSEGVDHSRLCLSYLEKPRLFLRVRPGHEKTVTQKLGDKGIAFSVITSDGSSPNMALSLAGGTKLDGVLDINREVVVQDLSSQQTGRFMNITSHLLDAWDCCAGSGGKSILFYDLHPHAHLTVSDIRESILKNLFLRFREAGLDKAQVFKADLTDRGDMPRETFSFIIADLPCTGSGTWARNPEALYYFKPEVIADYRQRQEKILSHVVTTLKKQGVLLYITCSVFADENERVASAATDKGLLKPEGEMLITGYGQGADSMYMTRFINYGTPY